jgi:hypothetical protein
VAGGETAAVGESAVVLEPGVAETAVRRDVAGGEASDGLLHDEADDLGADQAFGGEQAGVAGAAAQGPVL